jgi:hypothetical protein
VRSIALATIASTTLLVSPWIANFAIAGGSDRQTCDIRADYSFGIEDYPEAIRRHVEIVRKQPGNSLAHYHLGFALGMVGNRIAEINLIGANQGLTGDQVPLRCSGR